jgi:hypothetical protein
LGLQPGHKPRPRVTIRSLHYKKALFVFWLCLLPASLQLLGQQEGVAAQPPQTDPAVVAPATTTPAFQPTFNTNIFQDLVSAKAAIGTIPGTLIDTWHPFPKEWGGGHVAVEKRAASLYGQFVIGDALERGVIALDHESTHFTRRGTGGFFPRMGHIIVDTVVARKPDGSRLPAYSMLANDYGSWAIATLWCPPSLRNPQSIFVWGTGNVGVRALGNAVREFWPDVKSIFRKKHAPPTAPATQTTSPQP